MAEFVGRSGNALPGTVAFEHDLDEDGSFFREEGGELVLTCLNEGGHNGTAVKVRQVLEWLAKNRPALLELHVPEPPRGRGISPPR
jgi:hypothetical protein